MKAISTKFYAQTETKPSRVVAADLDGNRATVNVSSSDQDFGTFNEGAHDAAAIALCMKMHWDGPLMKGATRDGYVYVFDAHANRVRFTSNFAEQRYVAAVEQARRNA